MSCIKIGAKSNVKINAKVNAKISSELGLNYGVYISASALYNNTAVAANAET